MAALTQLQKLKCTWYLCDQVAGKNITSLLGKAPAAAMTVAMAGGPETLIQWCHCLRLESTRLSVDKCRCTICGAHLRQEIAEDLLLSHHLVEDLHRLLDYGRDGPWVLVEQRVAF